MKKSKIGWLCLGIILSIIIISVLLIPRKTLSEIEYIPPPIPPKPQIVIPKVMQNIASCESQSRQFNPDGSVYMGEINPLDTGKWQINQKYHLADAKKLGMDIFTLEGNTEFAMYLYKHEGTTPWNWSKWCWGKMKL